MVCLVEGGKLGRGSRRGLERRDLGLQPEHTRPKKKTLPCVVSVVLAILGWAFRYPPL